MEAAPSTLFSIRPARLSQEAAKGRWGLAGLQSFQSCFHTHEGGSVSVLPPKTSVRNLHKARFLGDKGKSKVRSQPRVFWVVRRTRGEHCPRGQLSSMWVVGQAGAQDKGWRQSPWHGGPCPTNKEGRGALDGPPPTRKPGRSCLSCVYATASNLHEAQAPRRRKALSGKRKKSFEGELRGMAEFMLDSKESHA